MTNMNFGQGVLIAVIGIALVFAVLFVLNLFIRLLSKTVRAIDNKSDNPVHAAHGSIAVFHTSAVKKNQITNLVSIPSPVPPGMQPAAGSLGEVKLHHVDEKTAAMIMAIVADQLQAPLNELRFTSIREIPGNLSGDSPPQQR